MSIGEELKANKDRLLTVYDLAALCYDYLIAVVINQGLFIGKYIMTNEKSEIQNPNLPRLNKFCERVEKELLKGDYDRGHLAVPFDESIEKICGFATKTECSLEEYGEDELNRATVSLYILYAIDRYLSESKILRPGKAPRNLFYCEKSYIYLAPTHNILDETAEMQNFPGQIEPLTISGQLQNIIVLERQEGAKAQQNPPNMVQLWIADGDEPRRQILKGKKLKIAVIPFEKVAMTEFPVRKGAVFEVEYTAWHKKNAIPIALKLLDEAIKQQANIVIFPEFVCSMELQEAMQEHLQQR